MDACGVKFRSVRRLFVQFVCMNVPCIPVATHERSSVGISPPPLQTRSSENK
ncbi:hypothetical protein WN51_10340 [Melipona quadrifasciata]|uniref:Uncharacterized protein n=1 Tax=Melipona quadrifasciata TaxID=166423 RepID=A0A0N1ITZ2_9HYME|nr:hypothetical protein WN51_10340 [Melipona quadrifasciata]